MKTLRVLIGVLGVLGAVPGLAATRPPTICRTQPSRLVALERKALKRCGDLRGCTPAAVLRRIVKARKYADKCVHLNQVQVVGTHNSYHIAPRQDILDALAGFSSAWDYTHPPLDQQFQDQGARQIELDVYADPDGGLYSRRIGPELLGLPPAPHPPELLQPGFKVLHIQDIDFDSNCLTFVGCLQTVKSWSDGHPAHLPLVILVEAEDDALPFDGFVVPIPIHSAQFDALDAEIRSVFPPADMITPDDVRGTHATLEEAVLAGAWPALAEARGKVLFLLDNASKRTDYVAGHPSLTGRILFTNADPGDPDAAFVEENDPLGPGQESAIAALVMQGYIVRTRADADTVEARSNDTRARDAGIASGAQYVSTDYPVPDPRFGTGYFVSLPDGMPGRCNPVNGPPGCRSVGLEALP